MASSQLRKARRAHLQASPQTKTVATQDSFRNAMARLGVGSPGTQGDNLLAGSTYAYSTVSRARQILENAYASSWIVARCINTIAEDMTSRGLEINSDADPQEIEKIETEWKRLRLFDQLRQSLQWSRLYGGSILVILTEQDPSTPLRPETIGKGGFKGLYALDRWQIMPSQTEKITTLGPDLGLPLYYEVLPGASALGGQKIHASRVIRLEGEEIPWYRRQAEMGWGLSTVERLWDRLVSFDSATMGTAQLVFRAYLRTLKIPGLRDALASGAGLEEIAQNFAFIRAFQSNEGITLLDGGDGQNGGDTFETHSYSFAGLDNVLIQLGQQVCGAVEIPATKLFGISPAGMSATGESDLELYYGRIESMQNSKLRTGMGTLIDLTWRSVHGVAPPEGTDFRFRPLWQMSDLEKSQVAQTTTATIISAFSEGLIDKPTALKELRSQSHETGTWTHISDEIIAQAEAEPPPVPELPEPPAPSLSAKEADKTEAA